MKEKFTTTEALIQDLNLDNETEEELEKSMVINMLANFSTINQNTGLANPGNGSPI